MLPETFVQKLSVASLRRSLTGAVLVFCSLLVPLVTAHAEEPAESIDITDLGTFIAAQFTCQVNPPEGSVCSGDEYLLQQSQLRACVEKLVNDFFTLGKGNTSGLRRQDFIYQTGAHGCQDARWSSQYHYVTKTLFFIKRRR